MAKKITLNKKDMEEIARSADILSVEEISEKIGKPVHIVSKAIERYKSGLLGLGGAQIVGNGNFVENSTAKILYELHSSPYWPQIQTQFDMNEQRFYEDQYCILMEQFGKDIVGTEILQVHQLITYVILGQRAMGRVNEAKKELSKLRREYNGLLSKAPPPEERSREFNNIISHTYSQIEVLENRLTSNNREFKELDSNQQKLMEQLKGTREQRVKSNEEGKTSFFDLLREIKDIEGRKKMNRQAQLSKIAMEKRTEELSKPIKYADGTVDSPVLSPSYLPKESEIIENEDPGS